MLTPRLPGTHRPDVDVIETGYVDVVDEWKRRLHLDHKRTLQQQFNLPPATRPNSQTLFTSAIDVLRRILTFPDATKGWLRFAGPELGRLSRQPFDAIVSTSPPITSHLIARQAKQLLNVPWIADFRDLWALNVEADFLRSFERRLEKRVLAHADALVTVSDAWAESLRATYGSLPVFSVTNGFDSDEFPRDGRRLTDRFSITYTGQLYRGRRDPTPVLETLRDLIAENLLRRDRVRLRFYGPIEPWLPMLVNTLGLADITELAGTIPRQKVIERQRESQLLLQLGWYDPRETGQHTGKLFEYLGSRRPIVAVGGSPGVMTELLKHTGAGVHLQSRAELRDYLIMAYQQFENSGAVPYYGREQVISQYTHLQMASKFATVLNTAVSRYVESGSPAGHGIHPTVNVKHDNRAQVDTEGSTHV